MLRGMISGVFWGAVVGAVALLAVAELWPVSRVAPTGEAVAPAPASS